MAPFHLVFIWSYSLEAQEEEVMPNPILALKTLVYKECSFLLTFFKIYLRRAGHMAQPAVRGQEGVRWIMFMSKSSVSYIWFSAIAFQAQVIFM